MDGVEVSNNKAIEYRDHETPYLNGIVNKYELDKKVRTLYLIQFAAMASRVT